jgi:hypothetical protein
LTPAVRIGLFSLTDLRLSGSNRVRREITDMLCRELLMRYAFAVLVSSLATTGIVRGEDVPSKEIIDSVKRATVFVQVEGAGWKGTGSGFVVKVAKETLFVATNYHVLSGSNSDRRVRPTEADRIARATTVNLVFDSGARSERSVTRGAGQFGHLSA